MKTSEVFAPLIHIKLVNNIKYLNLETPYNNCSHPRTTRQIKTKIVSKIPINNIKIWLSRHFSNKTVKTIFIDRLKKVTRLYEIAKILHAFKYLTLNRGGWGLAFKLIWL